MQRTALRYLVCIACKKSLKLAIRTQHGKDIIAGTLTCACGRAYPITNGVPRMMPGALGRTPRVFGKKWNQFPEMHAFHEKQFLDWIAPVSPPDFKGKRVLDAGCGQGRHVACAASYAADMVFGIDASDAVDVAYQHTKRFPNACIVQADINHLPFHEKTFDYAYSIGVLHHLQHPERGFDALVRSVKRNGTVSVWVYGNQSSLIRCGDALRKTVLAHLPLRANYLLSLCASLALYPVVHAIYVPCNKSRAFRRLAPLNDFLVYLGKMPFRMVHEILYDQCIAPKAVYYAKDEFVPWFKRPDISAFSVTERNRNSWRGHATVR